MDIAQRLRDWQDYEPVKMFAAEMLPDLEEAASEIERLREALQKIASLEVTMGAAANLAEQVLSKTATP